MHYEPTHHTIVSVDVAGSGSLDDRQQLRMRAELRSMINGTLSLQSLDRAPVDRADLGDGMRLIFPAEVSPCSLLDPFVPNLASALRRHRETAADSLRLRLRVAVHSGLLHRDKSGWAGAPLVHCARLIDARPVRRALRLADQADLVLVVSQAMYESVVRHGYGLDPSLYRRLVIREKETSAIAWLYIPGEVQSAESSRGTTQAAVTVFDSNPQPDMDLRSPGFQSLDIEHAGRRRNARADPSSSAALTAESMIGAAHGQSVSPITSVGRDEELSAVLNMLTALGTGQGGVLWVEGEPGIGKSTLISAALAEASARGFSVRVAVGDELSQRLPLRSLLDATGDAASEVTAILHAGVGHSLPYAADSVPAAVEQFLVVVDRLCAIAPMVLAFDDLQCADDASLTAWHRLSLAVDQIPLLLVSACRPIPVRPAIAALRRGAIDRGAIVVSLNPLEDGQIAQLVGQLAGAKPGARLCRTMARAGGNPLYSRELLDALMREGRVQVDGGIAELVGELGQAPKGLAGAVRSRLDFLSPDATLILRIAALLGPNFSVADLATVTGRPAVDLVPVLDEAFTAGVLVEAGEQLQFRHGLIREAMQETTPASARSALHQQIARTLANAGLPTDRVAVHLAAAPDGIDGWALDWLASAAPVLTNQAPQLAAELLRHAVDRTPAADARWEGLVAALTRASHRLGRGGEAEKYARSALAHVRDPGLIAEMRWILGYVQGWAGRPEAIATIEHALDDPGLPRVWRARLQAMLAMVHFLAGHHDAAEATAGQALAAGEAAGDRFAMGYALHAMAIISGHRRDNARLPTLIDRALAVLGDDPDHVDLRLILHHNRIYALTVLDRIAEAETDLDTARRLASGPATSKRVAPST